MRAEGSYPAHRQDTPQDTGVCPLNTTLSPASSKIQREPLWEVTQSVCGADDVHETFEQATPLSTNTASALSLTETSASCNSSSMWCSTGARNLACSTAYGLGAVGAATYRAVDERVLQKIFPNGLKVSKSFWICHERLFA